METSLHTVSASHSCSSAVCCDCAPSPHHTHSERLALTDERPVRPPELEVGLALKIRKDRQPGGLFSDVIAVNLLHDVGGIMTLQSSH